MRFYLRHFHQSLNFLMPFFPVLGLYVFFVWTGLIGVDYGFHWDEWYNVDTISTSIRSEVWFPQRYIYPGMNHFLGLTSLLYDAFLYATSPFQGEPLKAKLINVIGKHDFLLRLRTIHIFVSGLACFWVYFMVWIQQKSRLEAFLAACILGLSWEFAYHSRFFTPDTIMSQFASLSMCLLLLSDQSKKRFQYLALASLAAGLACGSKYPGGALLLPLFVYAGFLVHDEFLNLKEALVLYLGILSCFSLAFFSINMGTIYQTSHFLYEFLWVVNANAQSWSEYTVIPGLYHLHLILSFLFMVAGSKFTPIAILMSSLAIIGMVSLFRQNKKWAFVYLLFPVFYIIFFSRQGVLQIRNMMVLMPFFAVLAARGWAAMYNRQRFPFARFILIGGLFGVLFINGLWLVEAAQTIKGRKSINFVRKFVSYVNAKPDQSIWVSGRLHRAIKDLNLTQAPQLLTGDQLSKSDYAAIYTSEAAYRWPHVRHKLAKEIFGPQEVNFDYSVSWGGDDRIILLDPEYVKLIGLPLQNR